MKIITIQKIGYSHPSQANWSWGIWQVSLIDSTSYYNMSFTCKESFGGDSRFKSFLRETYNIDVLELKGVYTNSGTQKITGVTKLPIVGGEKEIDKTLLEDIKVFLNL